MFKSAKLQYSKKLLFAFMEKNLFLHLKNSALANFELDYTIEGLQPAFKAVRSTEAAVYVVIMKL